ncbi:MAG: hypothetical protein II744_08985 [Eubacterium sp.]|nr:hypothetical protein [Eubacterium sp.]MBR6392683.1 hypothetical protein [Eubacterium sp.]MBR7073067.1 hypothetical protein [Eubacterium sp.]
MSELNGDARIDEAVCIDTKRIYDSCESKDCCEDLRVTFNDSAQAVIDKAEIIKTRDCDISAVSIDVDEVPFNRGYYSVDINFYFRLRFDTYSSPGCMPQTAIGYANFQKKCILYGSEGNVKLFTSTAGTRRGNCPEAPKYTNPTAKVQAVDPVVLDTQVVEVCHCRRHCCTNFPDSILENFANSRFPQNPEKAVLVTLGLFSIIQLSRDVQLMIPAIDFCIPERECACSTQSPCESFRNIDFPVNEFFPPDNDVIGNGALPDTAE